jgi:hypothetical protein
MSVALTIIPSIASLIDILPSLFSALIGRKYYWRGLDVYFFILNLFVFAILMAQWPYHFARLRRRIDELEAKLTKTVGLCEEVMTTVGQQLHSKTDEVQLQDEAIVVPPPAHSETAENVSHLYTTCGTYGNAYSPYCGVSLQSRDLRF